MFGAASGNDTAEPLVDRLLTVTFHISRRILSYNNLLPPISDDAARRRSRAKPRS